RGAGELQRQPQGSCGATAQGARSDAIEAERFRRPRAALADPALSANPGGIAGAEQAECDGCAHQPQTIIREFRPVCESCTSLRGRQWLYAASARTGLMDRSSRFPVSFFFSFAF